MEVGDYVRTKDGKIIKVGGEELYDINLDSIKSSPNIIDLIEVGDIVITNLIYKGLEKKSNYLKRIKNEVELNTLRYYVEHNERVIKSIVTREMLESMEYKIGE